MKLAAHRQECECPCADHPNHESGACQMPGYFVPVIMMRPLEGMRSRDALAWVCEMCAKQLVACGEYRYAVRRP